jgi:hypothetical protein
MGDVSKAILAILAGGLGTLAIVVFVNWWFHIPERDWRNDDQK